MDRHYKGEECTGTDITMERNVHGQTKQAYTVFCTSVYKTSLQYMCTQNIHNSINSMGRLTFKR